MRLKNVGIAVIILGALFTLGLMLSTTSTPGGPSDLLFTAGFYLWVMLPFAVLAALTLLIHRKGLSPASRLAALLTSILIVGSSAFVYAASIFGSESSTAALVFVVIPLYALAAIAVSYGAFWLLLRFFMPRRGA